jgi:hypothetical protein
MSYNHVFDQATERWVPMTQPSGGGAGGGGDASAANQVTEIARLEAISDRLPAARGPQSTADSLSVVAAPTDGHGTGTRAYNFAQATRTAIASASSAAVAIGTLGASREVMLVSSARCFIKWGEAGIAAAAASDLDVLALPADAMFHLRIPAGVTHFRVIRDTADGFLRVTPVV